MKKSTFLLSLVAAGMLSGCATTGDVAGGTGNAAFDDAAKIALDKNKASMKNGYAWTAAALESKYDPKTEAGKAFKESGMKLSMVEVAIYEGQEALKKGDEAAAMKKVKYANEIADAQIAQEETGKKFQILWK